MKVRVISGIDTQFAEPSTVVLRVADLKTKLRPLSPKLEASAQLKKSTDISLANRTHIKGLGTRTSGKLCFAKSDSPVPKADCSLSENYAAQLYIPNRPTPIKTRSMKTWAAVKKSFVASPLSPLHLFDKKGTVKCTEIGISPEGLGLES